MGTIIRICDFILLGIKKIREFAISLPGLLVGFFTAVLASIASVYTFVIDNFDDVLSFFQVLDTKVQAFQGVVNSASSNSAFGLLNYCLALDTLFSYVFNLALLPISCIAFIINLVVVGLLGCIGVFLVLRYAGHLIQVVTAGLVKVNS